MTKIMFPKDLLVPLMCEETARTDGARGQEDTVGSVKGDRGSVGRSGRAHERSRLARTLCRRRVIVRVILLCFLAGICPWLLLQTSPRPHAPTVMIIIVHLPSKRIQTHGTSEAFTRLVFSCHKLSSKKM